MPRKRYGKQAKKYLPLEERRGKRLAPPPPYRSWLEADVAQDLKKRKIKFEYEAKTIIFVEPAKTRRYTPDLCIGELIVEIKGLWTAADRRKMSEVIEQHPDLDIRLLFEQDNLISKNSKTRYSAWCERRGIKYAIGKQVPEEWINEYK
jgi:hypothetical protein